MLNISVISPFINYITSYFFDKTAFHKAVQNGDIKQIIDLLRKEYDVNGRDQNGETPLMYHIHNENVDANGKLPQLLLSHGADANAQDNEGKTYLHKTTVPFLAKMLISYGADLNIQDKLGNTALHYAAKNGHWPLINILATEENINIANEAGETAFDALMNEIENIEQTGKLNDHWTLRSYSKTYESLNEHFTAKERITHWQKLSKISETMSLPFSNQYEEEQDKLFGEECLFLEKFAEIIGNF